MANILIVDDDQDTCGMLTRMVRKMGHQVICAFRLEEGMNAAAANEFDVVFLDVRLPDGNGLDALPLFAESATAPEVIIITGAGDADGAELAIRSGAWDYIQKPTSLQGMKLPLVRALQYREEKHAKGRAPALMSVKRNGVIGSSPQILACFDLVARVATTDANILITGETGTGKELFAAAVHKNSARAGKPFVVLDCSALPETLVESLLFGHDKGAFTGAERATVGMIKQADGGTLFLDEVGELPHNIQKAFLRVLQERRFRPLGGNTEIFSDFRLIAATNRNLPQLVKEGTFREDLFFRLRTFSIDLPPLRERSGDIKELALYHLARVCERYQIGLKGFAPEFFEALAAYRWPGNVRELLHAVERAVAVALYEPTLHSKHLPDEIRISLARNTLDKASKSIETRHQPTPQSGVPPRFREYREAMDRQYLQDLLTHTGGKVRQACELSGLSRSRLYDLLKHHHLPQSD